jgi:hypothetical protein
MLLPTGWALIPQDRIQRFVPNGFALSVHYDQERRVYVGKIEHLRGRAPATDIPLTSRSFWSAALAMNVLYEEVWKNHVKYTMESI